MKKSNSKKFRKDRRSIAQLISQLENHDPQVFSVLKKIFPRTGRALRIGVTGFPGAGKSTIINQLVKTLASQKKKVGIVLMDPSSPFSGGALLGDRVRMKDIQTSPNVFIRSMATRGKMGGLNLAARYTADIFDAAGFDYIILETVGVGQLEIDITTSSDISLVVMTPDSGDEIQAMKAGLMEVADLFIINKMDKDKDRIYFSRIKKGLEWYSEARRTKRVSVLPMAALYGEGTVQLTNFLSQMLIKKRKNKLNLERQFIRAEMDIKSCLEEIFLDRLMSQSKVESKINQLIPKVRKRVQSPYQAAETILKLGKKGL